MSNTARCWELVFYILTFCALTLYMYSRVCQNERNWFQKRVRYSISLFLHTLKYTYLGVICSRPTAQSKVTIQHSHLNRKNITQNQKYKSKNNIKLIYLTFIHCTCKFEKYKQSFLSENYEQTFHNKKNKDDESRSNQGRKVRHFMCTRVLRRQMVFLRVCCNICVRCSILISLIKTVRCSISSLQKRSLQHTPLYFHLNDFSVTVGLFTVLNI